ncbi:alkane-1 monooxygenase, putative [Oceanicola granulosus HTCC2516]|uniref:Alkane-1 monooxygenase, putative n=1 Tax=Oceanicola granulosus (strain ATCC BAA-861 / DSM 15982 / KCTC 12143 / HTCC2516) TaxID=314256 RepID=Q2CIF8_OCEGH|nr:alkane 1-monooxygenase [Oceanicola granulosus]EAR52300.1 alkane-1 monooxygenase, putative [Oceanicola granulosus HTCC2516]
MRSPMPVFALVTLLPLPLIALAATVGGAVSALALAYMTLIAAALDELVALALPEAEDRAEFPAADGLSVALALGHFALLALAVAALAGDWLGAAEKLALFGAAGLFFGQLSNANAHELIHRPGRRLRGLGRWVYISLLFGHHASAHPLVHHVRVATRADPNSARPGEGYYRFAARAWRGSFREGLRAETARLERAGRPRWRHPYLVYGAGAAACLAAAALLGGWPGLAALLSLALFAQSQLLLSDYVQHYGLTRATGPNGRPEPVAARHSWNAPHWFTSALMLNAPRHSDHHAHPARPFPALRLAPEAPMLPRSLPVMAVLALSPPHWRRVMDPRAARWRAARPADLAAE